MAANQRKRGRKAGSAADGVPFTTDARGRCTWAFQGSVAHLMKASVSSDTDIPAHCVRIMSDAMAELLRSTLGEMLALSAVDTSEGAMEVAEALSMSSDGSNVPALYLSLQPPPTPEDLAFCLRGRSEWAHAVQTAAHEHRRMLQADRAETGQRSLHRSSAVAVAKGRPRKQGSSASTTAARLRK